MFAVKDLMTTRLITLSPMDTVKTARETMEKHRIRHLPVVTEQNDFVGLVSHRDILRASISQFADLHDDVRDQIESGIPIPEVMTTEIMTISSNAPLQQAGTLLLTYKYGCLPVLEDKKLCGILTETDFLKLALRLIDERAQAE